MLPSAGTLIDNQYEIISVIGVGGYGVVFQARQINLDRIVALKLLSANVAEDRDASQRFEREIQIMKNLKHRNLVMVYGSGVWDERRYLTMEYLDGNSLDRVLAREGKLDSKRTSSIMTQLLDGLACAHKHGIIHRDLKPSNVVIIDRGGEEVVKLIDFGLAKYLPGSGNAQHVTEAGYAVGSVMYMAPEQCLAQAVDHRSDIYAAGCILQRCLTGEAPYGPEGSTIEAMQQHVLSSPILLTEMLPSSGEVMALQMVLSKALAKHAEDRYQTADIMAADLNLIVTDRSTEISCTDVVPPEGLSLPPKEKPLWARTRMIAGICAGVALAACIMMSFRIFDLRQQSDPIFGKSSIDVFRMATQALQEGDSEGAAKYYALSLEKKSDGRLQPLMALEAYLFLSDHFEQKNDEKGFMYARDGVKTLMDSQAPVGDKALTMASVLMRACNRQLQPRKGLAICSPLLQRLDPILIGGGVERLQTKMLWGYGMAQQTDKGRELLKHMHLREQSGVMLLAEGKAAEAEIEFVEGNTAKAIELLKKTSDTKYVEGLALPTLARAYVAVGNYDAAKRALDEHRQMYSNRPTQVIGVYAVLAAEKNDFTKARNLIQLVIDRNTINSELFTAAHLDFDLQQLAKLAQKAGKEQEAKQFTEAYNRAKEVFQQSNPRT